MDPLHPEIQIESRHPEERPITRQLKHTLPWPAVALLALLTVLAVGFGLGYQRVTAGAEVGSSGPVAGSSAGAEATGRIVVKLAAGARLAEKSDGTLTVVQDWTALTSAATSAPGLALKQAGQIAGLGICVLEPAGADLARAVRQLRLMRGVLWAEVSQPVYACKVPNDPLYPPTAYARTGQWSLPHVGLPEAWDVTTGSPEVIVAIVDSGLNRDILDFVGRIVSPYSVLTNSAVWPAWQDNYGHGSGVAGVAVSRGDDHQGIAGAAWNVKIMPVKMSERDVSDDVTLAEGITYAVDHGADVINVSFATPPGYPCGQALREAVDYALTRNVVVVAAAGNNDGSPVGYPAAIPGVIAVGATDALDMLCDFSNLGTNLDLVAPGDDILTYDSDSAVSLSPRPGTSYSSPLVAGAVALMKSVNPSLTPEEAADILAETADDLGANGWDERFGSGLLDADEAVVRAVTAASTTTTTIPPSTTTTTTVPSTTTTTTVPPSTTTTTTPRFSDVSAESTPYWNEIGYLAGLGVVSGSGGRFYPQSGLMRQQVTKMIAIALRYPVTHDDMCPFWDVTHLVGDLYPYHYVAVAYQRGITVGTGGGRFSPYRTLTRAEMITMVARAAGLPDPAADYVPPFPEFPGVHYAFAKRAASAGLLGGLVGMGPDYTFASTATRGEVCALLYDLLQQGAGARYSP